MALQGQFVGIVENTVNNVALGQIDEAVSLPACYSVDVEIAVDEMCSKCRVGAKFVYREDVGAYKVKNGAQTPVFVGCSVVRFVASGVGTGIAIL